MFMAAFLVSAVVSAGSISTQESWEDGPGVPGPVSSWDGSFFDTEGMAWLSVPSQLCLASEPLASPVRHDVSLSFDGCYSAAVGDANGDGFNDLAATAFGGNELRLWLSDGQGGWVTSTVNSCTAEIGCCFADIDSDGTLDILTTTYSPGSVRVYTNQGGEIPGWDEQIVDSSLDGMHDAKAFDIDRDGDLDIAAASAEDDQVVWWRNDGGSPILWAKQTVGALTYPCRLDVCDLDGNGKIDVVAAGYESDRIQVWYGSGGPMPAWTGQVAASGVNGAHGVGACDMDGDGDLDLVCAGMDDNSLFWLRNGGGSPVAWTVEDIGTFGAPGCSEPADIDGDGDYDVSCGSFGSAGAAWWENQDSGTTWVKHQVVSGLGTIPLTRAGDVDNDGDLDLVCSGFSGDRLFWVEATLFLDSGWLESSILDTGCQPQYASFDWEASAPSGTSMAVQFRTSDDPSSMGGWSAPYTSPSTVSGQVDRYFQYRLAFTTADESASPIVDSFCFGFDPTGIGPEAPGSLSIGITCGNPCRSGFSVHVENPEGGPVEVLVYDASGRVAAGSELEMEMEGGCGATMAVDGLVPGVYLVVAHRPTGGSARASVTVL